MWAIYVEGSSNFVIVPYEKGKHAKSISKFLYWKNVDGNEVLIAGAGQQTHHHLLYYARAAPNRPEFQESFPHGVGWVNGGKVEMWDSEDFIVKTSEELKPIIREALGLT